LFLYSSAAREKLSERFCAIASWIVFSSPHLAAMNFLFVASIASKSERAS
jgi:hypothetical protein